MSYRALPSRLLSGTSCVAWQPDDTLRSDVTANPERLRFYVDESALGVGKALAAAREDTIHVGHPLIPECPTGVEDPDWISAVAARGLIVIGRDKHIRTRPAEVRHLLDAGLRAFYLGG